MHIAHVDLCLAAVALEAGGALAREVDAFGAVLEPFAPLLTRGAVQTHAAIAHALGYVAAATLKARLAVATPRVDLIARARAVHTWTWKLFSINKKNIFEKTTRI